MLKKTVLRLWTSLGSVCPPGHQEELKVKAASEDKIITSKELCTTTGSIVGQSQQECAGGQRREATRPQRGRGLS